MDGFTHSARLPRAIALMTLATGKAERSARPRRAHARWHRAGPYNLEFAGPILIRHSRDGDDAALQRLAALDSRKLPEGSFLLAEVGGELVAATPLDVNCEPLANPFRPTANVRELLELQARHVRRNRGAAILPKQQFSYLVNSAGSASITVAPANEPVAT